MNHLRPRAAALLLLVVAVALGGCRGRGSAALSDESVPIRVGVGERFTVVLASNPSTGYEWALGEGFPAAALREVGSEYVADRSRFSPPANGAGGRERWTFEAVEAGEVTLPLVYHRPWEGGGVARRAAFQVVVD
jgi:inhibitor of cysteine peptidase